MTKNELDELVKIAPVMRREAEADGMVFDDATAFDFATILLEDNDGMSEAIEKHYKAIDTVGWLANKF